MINLLIPIITGCLSGYLINYLADILPFKHKFTAPYCKNQSCQAKKSWVDYFLMRRCRKCRQLPSLRFFLVMLVSVVFLIYLWVAQPTKMGFWLGTMVFFYLLLVALIDLENRYVLRPLSLIGLVFFLIVGFAMNGWRATLIGAAAGFGIMLIFFGVGRIISLLRNKVFNKGQLNEEALGFGDVILSTLLGLLLGWPLILLNLLGGILLAGIFSILLVLVQIITKKYVAFMGFIAYGPFLIFIAFLLLYFPKWISTLLVVG